jgi:hypothetical protein
VSFINALNYSTYLHGFLRSLFTNFTLLHKHLESHRFSVTAPITLLHRALRLIAHLSLFPSLCFCRFHLSFLVSWFLSPRCFFLLFRSILPFYHLIITYLCFLFVSLKSRNFDNKTPRGREWMCASDGYVVIRNSELMCGKIEFWVCVCVWGWGREGGGRLVVLSRFINRKMQIFMLNDVVNPNNLIKFINSK